MDNQSLPCMMAIKVLEEDERRVAEITRELGEIVRRAHASGDVAYRFMWRPPVAIRVRDVTLLWYEPKDDGD